MTEGLPPGWAIARLQALVGRDGVMSDGDWVESKDQDPDGEVRLIQLADVGDGKFLNKSNRFLTQQKADLLNCTLLAPRDVLISRLGEPLGKACLFPPFEQPCVTVVDVHVVRPVSEEVSREWLMHSINSAPVRRVIDSMSSGTTRKRVTGQKLKDLEVRVPPVPEQARIASKIDELFSRIEEGERALERVQKLVERYRHSVLKAAVTGELTRDWREKNKGQLESGEALLSRILKARREAWETAEVGKMKSKGITPAKDKWKRKYEEPAPPDTAELPELPDGWAWVTLGHLTRELDQGWSPQCESTPASPDGTDWGVIKTTAIQAMRYEGEANKALPSKFEPRHRLEVRPGDILVTRAGPRTRVGICCLVRATRSRLMICDKVYRLRPLDLLVSQDYVEIALNSPLLLRELEVLKSGISDSGLNLTQERFLSLAVPLPPVAEQQRIADAVAEALSEAETSAHYAELNGNALRQAILKIAFCGRLVAQSPEDEPADQLLARLAAERVAGLVSQHGRKGRRAT